MPANTKRNIGISSILIVGTLALVIFALRNWDLPSTQEDYLSRRLTECESYPNNSTRRVVETSRIFINIPKDIYPDASLIIKDHEATAGYASSGKAYGEAISGKPGCSSHYMEFSGNGTVDISSRSGTSTIPDYSIHFIVYSK